MHNDARRYRSDHERGITTRRVLIGWCTGWYRVVCTSWYTLVYSSLLYPGYTTIRSPSEEATSSLRSAGQRERTKHRASLTVLPWVYPRRRATLRRVVSFRQRVEKGRERHFRHFLTFNRVDEGSLPLRRASFLTFWTVLTLLTLSLFSDKTVTFRSFLHFLLPDLKGPERLFNTS